MVHKGGGWGRRRKCRRKVRGDKDVRKEKKEAGENGERGGREGRGVGQEKDEEVHGKKMVKNEGLKEA